MGVSPSAGTEDAIAVYDRLLDADPSNAAARFNAGLAYLRLREPADAVREFSLLLRQDLTVAEAWYQRGNAYDDVGEGELALPITARRRT